MQRSPAAICTQINPSTLGEQDLCDPGVSRPGSRVQRGLPIFPLHIDRNTRSKQYLDNTNLSFPRCRVQQDSAVGTCLYQDSGDAGVP